MRPCDNGDMDLGLDDGMSKLLDEQCSQLVRLWLDWGLLSLEHQRVELLRQGSRTGDMRVRRIWTEARSARGRWKQEQKFRHHSMGVRAVLSINGMWPQNSPFPNPCLHPTLSSTEDRVKQHGTHGSR